LKRVAETDLYWFLAYLSARWRHFFSELYCVGVKVCLYRTRPRLGGVREGWSK